MQAVERGTPPVRSSHTLVKRSHRSHWMMHRATRYFAAKAPGSFLPLMVRDQDGCQSASEQGGVVSGRQHGASRAGSEELGG